MHETLVVYKLHLTSFILLITLARTNIIFATLNIRQLVFESCKKIGIGFFLECLYLNLINGQIFECFGEFCDHMFYLTLYLLAMCFIFPIDIFWGPYEWLTLSKFFLSFSFKYLQVFYISCKPFIYLNISITNITVDFVIFFFALPLGSNHFDWLIPNDIWF